MRKLKAFFIVCAAVFVVGMIMSIAGFGSGGVQGFEAVAEDHDWVSAGPGARVTTEMNDLDFDSIEAVGPTEVVIVGEREYAEIVGEYGLETAAKPKAGTAVAIFGKNNHAPVMEMDGKTLRISRDQDSEVNGIYLNFSSEDAYPTVIVFCPDKQLEQIKVNSSYSDVELRSISFKRAEIMLNFGDIEAENIVSRGITIESDDGDVELSGDLKGQTNVKAERGDIDIDTKTALKEYTMKLAASVGEITIGDGEGKFMDTDEEGYSYIQDGGEDTLILKADTGDIELSSGEADFD